MRFYTIDEVQADHEANGWPIEFRQLQAGTFTASREQAMCADISLEDLSVSRRIEVAGNTPEGHISVLAPVGQGQFSVNGQSIDGQGIFLLGSRTEILSLNNNILRVIRMQVPVSLLQETEREILDIWASRVRCQTAAINPVATVVQRIRLLMYTTLRRPPTGRWQVEQSSRLAADLVTIVKGHAETTEGNSRLSTTGSWRTIRRAREFIESHLADPIKIGEVCEYAATSLSKLERIFRRELRMTPSEYILARRLVAVNRKLKSVNSEKHQIVNVAMDYGMNHQGRFANLYRTRFGELPSETVRSS